MQVSEMTHDDIAEWIAGRLPGLGYHFAFANMTSAAHGEQPDVLGLDGNTHTILVEVKTSRADFKADAKKPWRKGAYSGMGERRVYLTTEGLLTPEEIPYGWELWEIHGKTKPMLRIVKGKVKKQVEVVGRYSTQKKAKWFFVHCDVEEYHHFGKTADDKKEALSWILKIIHRMSQDGIDVAKYANGKYCGGIKLKANGG